MPDSGTTTLLQVQAQVFSPRCAVSGCHIGEDAPFGLELASGLSAGNLIGVASAEKPEFMRIEPYNAFASYLYMKVTADSRIEGDPMPAFGPPLNAADIALIEAWIDGGAM